MALRSGKIEFGAMGVVKALAYAAVTYTIGHEIVAAVGNAIDPAPVTQVADTWKEFFEGIKSSPALKIGVQFVALAYLGQDFINARKDARLRSDKIEVFGSPIVKGVAVGSVATLVGAQIATAALTVGPFYAPLVTDGIDAFMRSLPVTPEAQQKLFDDVESPFSLHAIAVLTAYRYVRHDFVPDAVKGGLSGLQAIGKALAHDRSSGLDFSAILLRGDQPSEGRGGQASPESTDFSPSPF